MNIFQRIRAALDRHRHPHTGFCKHCGMTWASVAEHSTPYEWTEWVQVPSGQVIHVDNVPSLSSVTVSTNRRIPAHACFPLCEKCWAVLTIEERMPYYMALVDSWELGYVQYVINNPSAVADVPALKREPIRRAVLAGL